MILSNKFKTKFNYLCNFALSLAIIDGGSLIAIQILNFLLSYFFIQTPQLSVDLETVAKVGKFSMLIFILNTLNLAVIIFRASGLAIGLRYPILTCYRKALSRLPALMLFYLGLTLTVAAILLQFSQISPTTFPAFVASNFIFIQLATIILIPIARLTDIFIVNQDKNPIQALIAIYKYLRYQSNFFILITISIMYGLPLVVGALFATPNNAPYLSLLTALWILFCDLLTVAMYMDSAKPQNTDTGNSKKPTKVIVI